MNIIFLNWSCFCGYDTCQALIRLGHNVKVIELPDSVHTGIDEVFAQELEKAIREFHCEVAISLNFFPTVSIACQNSDCHYISWIYDNPQTKVYDKTAVNTCNHIFTFDSYMANELNKRGVATVKYAPLAANVERLTSMPLNDELRRQYNCEISFVGSLYNESHNFYERLIDKAKNPYLQGYIDGIIEAQKRVLGFNFMADCITPEINAEIRRCMPYAPSEGSFIREEEVYADYYLSRRLAYIDRMELLYSLGEFFDVHHYTHSKDTTIGKVKNCGTIDYFNEMPYLFRISQINLNCSLRSIKNGIPLRAMDIMGCGGFLMTNFQEDFLLHFEPDVHFVYYDSLQDALEKCDYYIAHPDKQQVIRNNALEIMSREHTFEIRLEQMLNSIK